ncbi:HI0074 family nucleotidyltransferase substrate-binding subunit [Clostridium chauvoei]|uniref:Nucleotidyltransferase substrate binding protein n=3 Tax=Clostridium chauvoei TaxID=46867 RepID=A0ABD4RHU1_9CLOT|nr:HI0074 family nucleotidyltransferase substrate-binding subunit [Clostridium chauvoei]ATD55575.1 nucleotidyltransferase [Clostridium chauvoei]ATD56749.1 nucleotidyltransferase [Clostridium chauvoei]MBX7280946.1 nucleotidyltransferase substrate binding protein [Clostridium chauvoei]MBX7283445.1 nucleotidyltransferase substrate binding protein [Clostridium chauvoei]MBX7285978.1 nucleotidyltransferase substrate binding protein [Clostridium chauvoei]
MSGILDKYDESINSTYNYTYRMLMNLKNIKEKYINLNKVDEITLEVYRDSIIKKYETLEELTWKLLSKIFKADGLDINSPRGCYKQAFKEGLIEDMIVWNNILLARNSTAHIYDETDYEAIKNDILNKYMDAIESLLKKISTERL